MKFDAQIFLSHVTTLPGVYQMRAASGALLYVGKAKNLKNRLTHYFHNKLNAKTQALMAQVVDIEISVTADEMQALILENNLIKTHRPKFNILLRDDKSYPYILLSKHDFPRLVAKRSKRVNKNCGEYFGPYPNVAAMRYTLDLLTRIFRMRQCEDSFFGNRSRPCLQYQIQRCSAPCVAKINRDDYAQQAAHTRDFLNGNNKLLAKKLQQQMMACAERQQYEQAAQLRDQLLYLQTISASGSDDSSANCDVLALKIDYGVACVHVIFVRDGKQIASESFFPQLPPQSCAADGAEILAAFITQFYATRQPSTQIICDRHLQQTAILSAFLTHRAAKKVVFNCKPRGKRNQWLRAATENASRALTLHLAAKLSMANRLQQLALAFAWQIEINRVECIDISHTQGAQTVAAIVVFSESGALKSQYRRYNIDGITGGDDCAAIAAALRRRFATGENLPDLLLIDGARAQLNSAIKQLQDLKITLPRVMAIAKGIGRKAYSEQFWLPGNAAAITLPKDSQAMHLLLYIRDSAHRFAINSHRSARGKKTLQSRLQRIRGVGVKRRQALLKHFGGLAMIEAASAAEISKVPSISENLAEEIYAQLHEFK